MLLSFLLPLLASLPFSTSRRISLASSDRSLPARSPGSGAAEATAQNEIRQGLRAETCSTTLPIGTNAPDALCWSSLSMNIWMDSWNRNNTMSCGKKESWAACFMRLDYYGVQSSPGDYGTACTQIDLRTKCDRPSGPSAVAGRSVAPLKYGQAQAFYAAYSISSLQEYLSVWATALTSASGGNAIGKIINSNKNPNTVANILASLINTYAVDKALAKTLISIIPKAGGTGVSSIVQSQSQAQHLMNTTLAHILKATTTRFELDYFLKFADAGMLLQSTGETEQVLEDKFRS